MNKYTGFTLLEMMIVLIVASIFAAVAVPVYRNEIRKADAAAVEQEIQKLAEQLERYKSRNFSYHGFDPKYLYGKSTEISSFDFPLNKPKKYVIYLYDTSARSPSVAKTLLSISDGLGQRWAIIAYSVNDQNYHYFIDSSGVRCKNKTRANMTYLGCGTTSTGMITW